MEAVAGYYCHQSLALRAGGGPGRRDRKGGDPFTSLPAENFQIFVLLSPREDWAGVRGFWASRTPLAKGIIGPLL